MGGNRMEMGTRGWEWDRDGDDGNGDKVGMG